MGKTIGLKQLAQKKYNIPENFPEKWQRAIGFIEDTFDAILYGPSGSGKTNCAVELLKALLEAFPKAKVEYVSWEEGHGYTVQELMIRRHNMYDRYGNRISITEHIDHDSLYNRMNKRQSAKIFVFDSIQASGLSWDQYRSIKEKFVGGRNETTKKIILNIGWGDGLKPNGSVAQKIEYYCNIKMRVEGKIMFPKSRYGGNNPFVIWKGQENEQGALKYWGKDYYKISGEEKPKRQSKSKSKTNTNDQPLSTIPAGDNSEPVISQPGSQTNCETLKPKTA